MGICPYAKITNSMGQLLVVYLLVADIELKAVNFNTM